MIKGLNNVPLSRVQFLSDIPSPPKSHMKISNHKFPPDFFKINLMKKISDSTPTKMRNESHTHHQNRLKNRLNSDQNGSHKRENLTARNSRQKDEELIMGVISTTRQMKRIIRKHSLQLKKDQKGRNLKMQLELPPLILRKGIATAN